MAADGTKLLRDSMASTGTITVNVFDGRRLSFADGAVLLTVRDGNQKEIVRRDYQSSSVQFQGLAVFHNFGDNYTAIASANGYTDAGFFPVKVEAGVNRIVDLMVLPRSNGFNFSSAKWAALAGARPQLKTLFAAGSTDDTTAGQRYSDLMDYQSGATLACLLNITTAALQALLPQGTALDYLKEVIWDRTGPNHLAQDRFFGWADPALISQLDLARQQGTFVNAPFGLHPGATRSYKQIQFGEANIQLTFHEGERKEVGGINCVLIEPDIDYYKDTAAHLLLEVLVNAFGSLTDPRQVYALRWIAGRQAGIPEFDPLYTIEKA